MTRVRTDNVLGTTTDNPLTAGATTMNSAGLANLAVVSSAEAIIILDPNRVNGAPEHVVVTAHTGSATSATIVRGQFGTTAREHPQGTEWVHGPIASNATSFATAADDQGDFVPMNAWSTWPPVVTQSNTPTQAVAYSEYVRIGRLIVATFAVTFSGAGTASNAIILTGLPVAAANVESIRGVFRYFDAGNTNRAGTILGATTTTALFAYDGFGANMGAGDFAIANGDIFQGQVTYQAAS